jgi:hypothetical protein
MITNPLIEQGRQRGIQESIIRLLSYRFPQIPEDLQKRISSLNDIQRLQNLLDASLEVDSLERLTSNGFFDE